MCAGLDGAQAARTMCRGQQAPPRWSPGLLVMHMHTNPALKRKDLEPRLLGQANPLLSKSACVHMLLVCPWAICSDLITSGSFRGMKFVSKASEQCLGKLMLLQPACMACCVCQIHSLAQASNSSSSEGLPKLAKVIKACNCKQRMVDW